MTYAILSTVTIAGAACVLLVRAAMLHLASVRRQMDETGSSEHAPQDGVSVPYRKRDAA